MIKTDLIQKDEAMFYFIVNKQSRSGKAAKIWEQLCRYLAVNQIEYEAYVPQYEGHATELTQEICEKSDAQTKIVVVGGDGTANEVINGITDFEKVCFAIIPTGSGNDLARGLQCKGKPLKMLERIVNSQNVRKIDLGRVRWNDNEGTRLFAISSGIGMDAIVCKKALTSKLKKILNKLHIGKLTYLFLTVQTLFDMNTMEAEVGGRTVKQLIFAAAMNFRAEGGGVPMAPKADPSDGLLSVCCVSGIPKWRSFFVLPVLVAAKHERLKGVEVINAEQISFRLSEPAVLHADGEYVGDVSQVRYECLPQMLKIII